MHDAGGFEERRQARAMQTSGLAHREPRVETRRRGGSV